MLKEFQLLASTSYPTDEWINLGTYTAEEILGEQLFNITGVSFAHTRYIKVRFLTHYSEESLCTISQIKVHGMTVIESFTEDVESTLSGELRDELFRDMRYEAGFEKDWAEMASEGGEGQGEGEREGDSGNSSTNTDVIIPTASASVSVDSGADATPPGELSPEITIPANTSYTEKSEKLLSQEQEQATPLPKEGSDSADAAKERGGGEEKSPQTQGDSTVPLHTVLRNVRPQEKREGEALVGAGTASPPEVAPINGSEVDSGAKHLTDAGHPIEGESTPPPPAAAAAADSGSSETLAVVGVDGDWDGAQKEAEGGARVDHESDRDRVSNSDPTRKSDPPVHPIDTVDTIDTATEDASVAEGEQRGGTRAGPSSRSETASESGSGNGNGSGSGRSSPEPSPSPDVTCSIHTANEDELKRSRAGVGQELTNIDIDTDTSELARTVEVKNDGQEGNETAVKEKVVEEEGSRERELPIKEDEKEAEADKEAEKGKDEDKVEVKEREKGEKEAEKEKEKEEKVEEKEKFKDKEEEGEKGEKKVGEKEEEGKEEEEKEEEEETKEETKQKVEEKVKEEKVGEEMVGEAEAERKSVEGKSVEGKSIDVEGGEREGKSLPKIERSMNTYSESIETAVQTILDSVAPFLPFLPAVPNESDPLVLGKEQGKEPDSEGEGQKDAASTGIGEDGLSKTQETLAQVPGLDGHRDNEGKQEGNDTTMEEKAVPKAVTQTAAASSLGLGDTVGVGGDREGGKEEAAAPSGEGAPLDKEINGSELSVIDTSSVSPIAGDSNSNEQKIEDTPASADSAPSSIVEPIGKDNLSPDGSDEVGSAIDNFDNGSGSKHVLSGSGPLNIPEGGGEGSGGDGDGVAESTRPGHKIISGDSTADHAGEGKDSGSDTSSSNSSSKESVVDSAAAHNTRGIEQEQVPHEAEANGNRSVSDIIVQPSVASTALSSKDELPLSEQPYPPFSIDLTESATEGEVETEGSVSISIAECTGDCLLLHSASSISIRNGTGLLSNTVVMDVDRIAVAATLSNMLNTSTSLGSGAFQTNLPSPSPISCFETLNFTEFSLKMRARLENASKQTTETDRLLGDKSGGAPSRDRDNNVFRMLIQKIKSLELHSVIVEKFTAHLHDCYRSVAKELMSRHDAALLAAAMAEAAAMAPPLTPVSLGVPSSGGSGLSVERKGKEGRELFVGQRKEGDHDAPAAISAASPNPSSSATIIAHSDTSDRSDRDNGDSNSDSNSNSNSDSDSNADLNTTTTERVGGSNTNRVVEHSSRDDGGGGRSLGAGEDWRALFRDASDLAERHSTLLLLLCGLSLAMVALLVAISTAVLTVIMLREMRQQRHAGGQKES